MCDYLKKRSYRIGQTMRNGAPPGVNSFNEKSDLVVNQISLKCLKINLKEIVIYHPFKKPKLKPP